MPPPLLPPNSKPEAKVFQSSKTVPSCHDQSKKRGENYRTKVSPSVPQGTVKKRSAFEDLTNASQSQPVQSKKKANKEFAKYVSKEINMNSYALGVAQNNEMKRKRCKLELLPVVSSTTLMPNLMEKQLILDISTKPQTSTTKEPSLLTKPLTLKEEPAVEETTLIKKALKKHTNNEEVSLLENSLSLQEETGSDDEFSIQPVTLGKKHKPEEAAITEKTSSKEEMCTYEGKQDRNVEKNSFFTELLSFGKKPKAEESSFTKKLLHLKKRRCKTRGKVHRIMKPLVLQEITYEENSLSKEPLSLKEKPTAEESLLWKPTALQEKHTTEQEVPILKKSLAFQEKINFEEESLFENPSAFKGKPATEEATLTTRPLFLKKKCTIPRKKCTAQCKRPHVKNPLVYQEVPSGDKSFITKPLFVKNNPTTEEESLFHEPSSLQEKHTTQRDVGILKKEWESQDSMSSDDNSFMQPVTYKRKHTTVKKATPLKKKKYSTRGKASRFRPLQFQVVIPREKLLTKEPLPFQKSTTEEDDLFQGSPTMQEKHTVLEEMSTLRKPLFLQKSPTEEEPLFQGALDLKKQHIEVTTPTKKLWPLKQQQYTTQGTVSHWKKPLVCQMVTSGEKSLSEEPLSFQKLTTEKDFLLQQPSELQEKHTALEEVFTSKKPLALQKSPTEESLFQEALAFKKEGKIDEATPTKKSLPLEKQEYTTQGIASHEKTPLVLQSPTSEKKSLTKNPFSFKENVSLEKEECITQTMPFCQKLSDWQEIIDEDKNSFFTEPVSFRNKPKTEEEFLSQEPSALKEKYTTLQEMSPSKRSLALPEKVTTEEESYNKEPMTLKEKPIDEEEVFIQELFSLHDKPANRDESHFQKVLDLQEKTDTENDSSNELLGLEEESTTEEESLCNKLSVWKKEPFTEAPISLERQLSLKEESSDQGQTFLLSKQLVLYKNITNDEESFSKQPLALQEYPSIEKEAHFKEFLAIQEKSSTEKMAVLKKPLILQGNSTVKKEAVLKEQTIDTEAHFKKCLTLQENPSEPLALQEHPNIEKEAPLKNLLAFQKNPSIEKEATLKEPLALQEKPNIENEAGAKESSSLHDKPSVDNEAILNDPLALQKEAFCKEIIALTEKLSTIKEICLKRSLEVNSTHQKDTSPKKFLISQVENSPHMSSNGPESITDKSSTINISSPGQSSTSSKSSACESDSKNPFLSQTKRTHIEKTTVEGIDKDHSDPFCNSIYAEEIFSYMKEREEKFILKKYMHGQIDITSDMRAILVDWLVEVQMTYEMSHETLYLAVKLVDHYLMKVLCKKSKLQLLGSTAFLIAAKFEEPYPLSVADCLYICEDMYQKDELLAMEVSILQTVQFDINIPVAYHFLRRYAMCLQASMKTLTLSRFICERTLQEYDYIHEKASRLAAGSFLLALYMKNLGHWAPLLEYYSGYKTFELCPLVRKLNILLTFQSSNRLRTVYEKYSCQALFEVTKIPLLDMSKLEEVLSC